MKSNYTKLAIMLVISFIIMYAVMFFNVAELNHIYLSTTRFYMALLMVSPMALVMLFMMGKMYPDKKKNLLIGISGSVVFILAFVLLRAQIPIQDVQYMKAMIPHHSSAILTSENADIRDPEVKKLAQEIIKAQKEEIAQMKKMLERLD
ncbi:MAG: DUF305 domain-containing protein [Nitrosopumilus sp.]|nr:DUF305 domain-containing protein [Nitrosopumilus sp.]